MDTYNEKGMTKSQWLFHTHEGRIDLRNGILAVVIAVIGLFPIYWMLQLSFKSDQETFGKIITYFPHQFSVSPWLQNLQDKAFLSSLKNSFPENSLLRNTFLLKRNPRTSPNSVHVYS